MKARQYLKASVFGALRCLSSHTVQPEVTGTTPAAIDDPSLSGDDQNDIDRYMHSFQFSEHQNTVSGLGAGCCSDLRTPRKDEGTTGIAIYRARLNEAV